MELSKKTTILFAPHMHRRLAELADHHRTSIGELVRVACERQYGLVSNQRRVAAVRRLEAHALSVDEAHVMGEQAIPGADEMLP